MGGAMIIAVPLSLGSAIFIAEIASPRMKAIIKPAIELLAGIPSVVYGFFGFILGSWALARKSLRINFAASILFRYIRKPRRSVAGFLVIPAQAGIHLHRPIWIPNQVGNDSFRIFSALLLIPYCFRRLQILLLY
jgi:ABC-type phosphate transport system permease subunit